VLKNGEKAVAIATGRTQMIISKSRGLQHISILIELKREVLKGLVPVPH
jgi:septum formation topological specificity factor MinE